MYSKSCVWTLTILVSFGSAAAQVDETMDDSKRPQMRDVPLTPSSRQEIILTPEIAQRIARHHVQISGRTNPQSIPLASLLTSFASRVRRAASLPEELHRRLPLLGPSDQRALAEIVSLVAQGNVIGLDRPQQRMTALISKVEGTGDPAELVRRGQELDDLQREIDDLAARYYESALSRLTRDGRRTFTEYLYREIAPSMSIMRTEYAALYRELAQLTPQLKALKAAQDAATQDRDGDATSTRDPED
jgi:hypothetical protein